MSPWLLAARPKTLLLTVSPVLVGSFLAPEVHWGLFFLILMGCAFVQIGTNLVNDALDFKKGADTSDRVGPQRATQMGWLTSKQVLIAAWSCFVFAAFVTLPVIAHSGPIVAVVLLVSIVAAYCYTGGPYPLAYNGLGEVFVIVFFGLVITTGSHFVQSGYFNIASALAGLQIGMLATLPLVVNNTRDYVSDKKVGKITVVVKYGPNFGKYEILFFLFTPFLLGLMWLPLGYPWVAFFPLTLVPLTIMIIQLVAKYPPGPMYNGILGLSVLTHLSFGLLLFAGIMVS